MFCSLGKRRRGTTQSPQLSWFTVHATTSETTDYLLLSTVQAGSTVCVCVLTAGDT